MRLSSGRRTSYLMPPPPRTRRARAVRFFWLRSRLPSFRQEPNEFRICPCQIVCDRQAHGLQFTIASVQARSSIPDN